MKNTVIFVIIIIIIVLVGVYLLRQTPTPDNKQLDLTLKPKAEGKLGPEQAVSMKISSPVFENEGTIPSKYTCDGDNINPPLKIAEVPEIAKSLVLIVDDPDAPAGTWIHWTVWNMPPETREIKEGSKPAGIEGITSFGRTGYGGPCPPSGVHRYFFKLYALDTQIELSPTAKIDELIATIKDHIIDQAQIMGKYSRQ